MKLAKKARQVLALTLVATSMVGNVTTVMAETTSTTSTKANASANVSAWAETEVKGFLGDNFNAKYNYKYPVNREEFAELADRALTKLNYAFSPSVGKTFNDTKNSSVLKLANNGFLGGKTDFLYKPNDRVSREEVATIMLRMVNKLNVKLPIVQMFDIVDGTSIAKWALPSVSQVYQWGLMSGTAPQTFNPKSALTREQAIVTLSRFVARVEEVRKTPVTPPNNNNNNNNTNNNNNNSNTTVDQSQYYTYDKATGNLHVKKDVIIDASVAGTPKDFNDVTVAQGVNVTFKGVNMSTLTMDSGSVKLEGVTIDECELGDVDVKADKSTKIDYLEVYGDLDFVGEDASIEKAIVTSKDSKQKVYLEASVKNLILKTKGKVTLGGTYDSVDVNTSGAEIILKGEVKELDVKAECDISVQEYAELDKLICSEEVDFEADKRAELGTIRVNSGAKNSTFEVESDVKFEIKAVCRINGKGINSDDKVEYKDGELIITRGSKDDAEDDKDEQYDNDMADVKAVYDYLTASNIKGQNSSLQGVTTNLSLPISYKGCKIFWESSNTNIVTSEGKVTRPVDDYTVRLTVTITKGEAKRIKTIDVTVLGTRSSDEQELTKALNSIQVPTSVKENFTVPTNTGSYLITWKAKSDNVKVNGYQVEITQTDKEQKGTITATVSKTVNNTTIEKSKDFNFTIEAKKNEGNTPSEIQAQINEALNKLQIPQRVNANSTFEVPKVVDGVTMTYKANVSNVTVTPNGDNYTVKLPNVADTVEFKLIATGTKEGISSQRIFVVTVEKTAVDESQKAQATLDSLTVPTTIDEGTTTVDLITNKDGFAISWESSNPSVISTSGAVTHEAEDVTVTLTAKITVGGKTLTRTFTTVVKGVKATDDTLQILTDAMNQMTLPNEVSGDRLDLPECPNKDIEVEWVSQNPDIITNDGAITKPSEDTYVTISLTLRLGGEQLNKDFLILVKGDEVEIPQEYNFVDTSKVNTIVKRVNLNITSDRPVEGATIEIYDETIAELIGTASNVSFTEADGKYVYEETLNLTDKAVLGKYKIEIKDSKGEVIYTGKLDVLI